MYIARERSHSLALLVKNPLALERTTSLALSLASGLAPARSLANHVRSLFALLLILPARSPAHSPFLSLLLATSAARSLGSLQCATSMRLLLAVFLIQH